MVSLHRHAFCWTVDENRWTVVSVLSLLSTIDDLCCTTLHLSKHADRSCCAIAAYLGKMNEQYGTDMHHVNLCEWFHVKNVSFFVMLVAFHKQTMFSIEIWRPLLKKQRASLDRRVCVLRFNENR